MTFDIALLGPALVAGILVVITHIPLGREVIRHGIIFLDLSIAQMAALGALIAAQAGFEPGSMGNQGSSFVAALCGALLLGWTERHWHDTQEAIIGTLFVASATAALLLLAHDAHGGEQLKDILAGQILWVSWSSMLTGAIALLCLLPVLHSSRIRNRLWFYPAFAVCVTLSVQWVGIYLVFSTLVIPALVTRHLSGNRQTITAIMLGIAGYAGGLWLSSVNDLPSGPLIVWVLLGVSILYALLTRILGRHLPTE
jgi:zinc/manganese transport system permease protein